MKMFFVVTVPVIFGMIVRSLMTDFIVSKTLIIQRLSIILFLVVFTSIWIEEWDRIVSFITRAGFNSFYFKYNYDFCRILCCKILDLRYCPKKMYFFRVAYKMEL